MKFCHFCAGKPMTVKVTIPLDQLLPQGSGEHQAPPLKPIVIVQCDQCSRIAQDDEP